LLDEKNVTPCADFFKTVIKLSSLSAILKARRFLWLHRSLLNNKSLSTL
jgi:hypothetical protein